jgi:hypothetical protein
MWIRIRIRTLFDPGYGIRDGKIRIRDKLPRPATQGSQMRKSGNNKTKDKLENDTNKPCFEIARRTYKQLKQAQLAKC